MMICMEAKWMNWLDSAIRYKVALRWDAHCSFLHHRCLHHRCLHHHRHNCGQHHHPMQSALDLRFTFVARCHAQRMMTVKMDDKMIRMARWPGYDKMTQARVLLINPLPCLALSPPCHLARSAGRPQKTPGKKHWHGQVGREERNLLRKTVSLCNLCVGWHCPGQTFPPKVDAF